MLLVGGALIAIFWANSPWSGAYHALLDTPLTVGAGEFILSKPLILWINDALMAVFFFLVGLEIKREVFGGHLRSMRSAALPLAGALGGVLVPAGLYLALNGGGPGQAGWGIPMATDIAFALGVLALVGDRVPVGLKVFLTALAIVDDIAAIMVIAVFYTDGIAVTSLGIGAVFLGLAFAANRAGVRSGLVYFVIGAVVWLAFLKSGVHATLAAVLMAFTIPAAGLDEDSPLIRLEHALAPLVAFVVLPVFALANAGVVLGPGMADAVTDPIAVGVVLGLLVGKPLGIFGAAWIAVKLGLASLPERTNWRQLAAVSILGGIGFTMALFVEGLAFTDPAQRSAAKVGVLGASIVTGVLGYLALRRTCPKPPSES